MKTTNETNLSKGQYRCPKCDTNKDLVKIEEIHSTKILFFEFDKKTHSSRFMCKRCNATYYKLSELTNKNIATKKDSDGITRTTTTKTVFTKDKTTTVTTEKVDFLSYVPKDIDRDLYFTTIVMLMDFIQEKDESIDIYNNKFYQQAIEELETVPDFEGEALEVEILKNIDITIHKLKKSDRHSMFRKSVNVLKNNYTIQPSITDLYNRAFEKMGLGQSEFDSYFNSLF